MLHHMSLTCCRKSHRTPAALSQVHTPCLFSIDMHTIRQHLLIAHFLLLVLLSGTLFQMMSDVSHHCHHLSLVRRHTCFIQFAKTDLSLLSLYICAWFGLVAALLMAFLRKCINVYIYKKKRKKVYLINLDCLSNFMLLYIMPVYLMLFAACLFNAFFVFCH